MRYMHPLHTNTFIHTTNPRYMETPHDPLNGMRVCWLAAVCAVGEGADVPLPSSSDDHGVRDEDGAAVVREVLRDVQRVSVLGGIEGRPRSLGSVLGGIITRFLTPGISSHPRKVVSVPTRGICKGIAVGLDGSSLYMSTRTPYTHKVINISTEDGSLLCMDESSVRNPRRVAVKPDGCVLVVDTGNKHILEMSDGLEPRRCVGFNELECPIGVVANDDIMVVTGGLFGHLITVLGCYDGAVVRRFGSYGRSGEGLRCPCDVCFVSDDSHVAVTDCQNHRISMFTIRGKFVRHIGVGVLKKPRGVACSAANEIVVADRGNWCLRLFSDSGEFLKSFACGNFTRVCTRGDTVFAVFTKRKADDKNHREKVAVFW